MDKTKIRISYDAYYALLDSLNERDEFNCLRLEVPEKGCGPKIDLVLDKVSPDMVIETIDELPLVYGPQINKKFKSITIVFNDDSFKIKTEGYDDHLQGMFTQKKKDCSSCSCPKRAKKAD